MCLFSLVLLLKFNYIHHDRAKHYYHVVLNMARITENYTCVTLSEGGWIISNSLVHQSVAHCAYKREMKAI